MFGISRNAGGATRRAFDSGYRSPDLVGDDFERSSDQAFRQFLKKVRRDYGLTNAEFDPSTEKKLASAFLTEKSADGSNSAQTAALDSIVELNRYKKGTCENTQIQLLAAKQRSSFAQRILVGKVNISVLREVREKGYTLFYQPRDTYGEEREEERGRKMMAKATALRKKVYQDCGYNPKAEIVWFEEVLLDATEYYGADAYAPGAHVPGEAPRESTWKCEEVDVDEMNVDESKGDEELNTGQNPQDAEGEEQVNIDDIGNWVSPSGGASDMDMGATVDIGEHSLDNATCDPLHQFEEILCYWYGGMVRSFIEGFDTVRELAAWLVKNKRSLDLFIAERREEVIGEHGWTIDEVRQQFLKIPKDSMSEAEEVIWMLLEANEASADGDADDDDDTPPAPRRSTGSNASGAGADGGVSKTESKGNKPSAASGETIEIVILPQQSEAEKQEKREKAMEKQRTVSVSAERPIPLETPMPSPQPRVADASSAKSAANIGQASNAGAEETVANTRENNMISPTPERLLSNAPEQQENAARKRNTPATESQKSAAAAGENTDHSGAAIGRESPCVNAPMSPKGDAALNADGVSDKGQDTNNAASRSMGNSSINIEKQYKTGVHNVYDSTSPPTGQEDPLRGSFAFGVDGNRNGGGPDPVQGGCESQQKLEIPNGKICIRRTAITLFEWYREKLIEHIINPATKYAGLQRMFAETESAIKRGEQTTDTFVYSLAKPLESLFADLEEHLLVCRMNSHLKHIAALDFDAYLASRPHTLQALTGGAQFDESFRTNCGKDTIPQPSPAPDISGANRSDSGQHYVDLDERFMAVILQEWLEHKYDLPATAKKLRVVTKWFKERKRSVTSYSALAAEFEHLGAMLPTLPVQLSVYTVGFLHAELKRTVKGSGVEFREAFLDAIKESVEKQFFDVHLESICRYQYAHPAVRGASSGTGSNANEKTDPNSESTGPRSGNGGNRSVSDNSMVNGVSAVGTGMMVSGICDSLEYAGPGMEIMRSLALAVDIAKDLSCFFPKPVSTSGNATDEKRRKVSTWEPVDSLCLARLRGLSAMAAYVVAAVSANRVAPGRHSQYQPINIEAAKTAYLGRMRELDEFGTVEAAGPVVGAFARIRQQVTRICTNLFSFLVTPNYQDQCSAAWHKKLKTAFASSSTLELEKAFRQDPFHVKMKHPRPNFFINLLKELKAAFQNNSDSTAMVALPDPLGLHGNGSASSKGKKGKGKGARRW